MIKFLKSVPLFQGLRKEHLEKIAKDVKQIHLKKGETLFLEGDAGDNAYVIKKGALNIVKNARERQILLAVRKRGEIIGEIALIDDSPRTATVVAMDESELLGISKKAFDDLLDNNMSASRTILKTVLKRWQKTENLRRQSEKMAQIGVLTAGITHELNNPSAAVQRSTKYIADELINNYERTKNVFSLNLTDRQRSALDKYYEMVVTNARNINDIDPLEKSDLEDEAEEWLVKNGVQEAEDLSIHVVNANLKKSELMAITKTFKGVGLSEVIHWLCSTHEVHSLVNEIYLGATQISEIVMALKSYSYLDQGPKQSVDVHKGIEDTLVILRSKLKNIEVKKLFDDKLPAIEAYGSELNQVWTNLIDNAISAMNGKGIIKITTKQKAGKIYVEIEDNGPGIPKDLQKKIFDPFFTTKSPGEGTGLGLDIVYNIVTHKHGGDIKLSSKKGETTFTIILPTRSKD